MPLVHHILERTAARAPERVALVCGGSRETYGALDARANQLAHELVRRGVERGDRVALYLDNSVDAVVALFATWKAGAVVVAINPQTKPHKLAGLLEDCGAALFVCAEMKLEGVRAAVACEVLTAPFALNGPSSPVPRAVGDDDLALLLYTSGSTGAPKGVVHGHRGLESVMRSIVSYLEQTERDVVLSVLPLSFGYGLTQLLPTFAAGGVVVLERSFAFPQAVLQKMQQERVTGFAMVPTIGALLLQNDLSRFDLTALTRITNAGAGIPPDMLLKLQERLPHTRFFPMYGQTECIRACYLPPEQVRVRPTSVGVPIPGVELTIVDDTRAPVGPDQVGELAVRGHNVMLRYWNLPAATAEKLVAHDDGTRTLYTGDLFRRDRDGWLSFVSRKDDIIKTRGEKVSPREVENVLHALAGVAEAAIIGVDDPVLGAVVRAFVVQAAGAALDEKTVLRHCASELEDFAVPKRVVFLSEMPKTANSKIDKMALKELREGSP